MLVTKSVFKLIFGLSNYQTCTFPSKTVTCFSYLVKCDVTITNHCGTHTPTCELGGIRTWRVALILSETTAISTERYNFSLFIVKVFSGKLFQKKIPDFCAKRG